MGSALRLGLFYAAVFIGTGASLPYMPVWFRAHGLSGGQIGLLLSVPMLARVITGPALAIWADGFQLRRTPMALMLGASAAAYAAIGFIEGYGAWLVCWFVAASLMSTVTPLSDVLTMRRAGREAFNYGWPRGIGSAAYIVANVGAGALLMRARPDAVLAWTASAALFAALMAVVLLPREPVHESGEVLHRRDRWQGLNGLLRDRTFLLAVVSIGAIQATHAFYYGFSALAWRFGRWAQLAQSLTHLSVHPLHSPPSPTLPRSRGKGVRCCPPERQVCKPAQWPSATLPCWC